MELYGVDDVSSSWNYGGANRRFIADISLLNKDVVEKNFNKEFNKFKVKLDNNKFSLNEEQKKSLSFIRSIGNNYNVTVLEGVTGSGKTLVYFKRIKDFIVFERLKFMVWMCLVIGFERK